MEQRSAGAHWTSPPQIDRPPMFPCRWQRRLAAFLLAGTCLLPPAAIPAWANGGSTQGAVGGADSLTGAGGDGQSSATTGGAGGGAGQTGGRGGDGDGRIGGAGGA